MSFSTLPFLFYFLPAFLAVYYIVPARFRNAVLALGSLLFYWLGAGTGALLVLVALILVNFAAGRLIEDAHGDERRAWLILALACDVGSLFYFKYMGWFLENLGRLTNTDFSFFRVALPLGVSFYVFQSIAYVADVYRGDAEAERSLLDYAAFQAMFPQLVMGPILRLRDVSAELHTKRPFSRAAVESGFSLFVVGLGCKVVLADQLASLWTALERIGFAYLSAPLAWFGAVGYSLQLYYDFAGYSLMAMGLARMLGFVIPRNFDLPYCSRSISEFWRRWHITLGDWFKSYIYFPMGGSRKGLPRTIINLLVVWTITGIWHGASWNFMLWGTYFGILIVIERLFLGKVLEKIPSFFSWLYTFIMVVFGWVMFDAVAPGTVSFGNVFEQIWTFISAMFGGNGVFIDNTATNYIVNYGIIFAVCIFGSSDVLKTIADYIRKKAPTWVQYGFPVVDTVIMLASVAYLSTSNYNPFLYFNF